MGCDIHLYAEKKVNGKWEYVKEIDVGRNYDLFSFLAGVRGDNQQFEQKGIPDDMSEGVREECEYWGADGHSHSYLTLEELQTVDWSNNNMIPQSGIMNNDQWEEFNHSIKIGKPDYSLRYPYWGMGGDEKTSSYHEWKVPITVVFNTFIEQVLEGLPAECPECIPNELRIVFWFDN